MFNIYGTQCLTRPSPGGYILKFGVEADPPLAALAQLVERSIRNRKVVGSTPMGGSIQINNRFERFSNRSLMRL